MQPAEESQMGMNIESCCTESSNKWTGERRYRVMEVKQCAAVEPRNGMSKRAGNVSLLTLRARTQMGKEIKEARIEYKREGAMSFRAVANQTNGRRKARQKRE